MVFFVHAFAFEDLIKNSNTRLSELRGWGEKGSKSYICGDYLIMAENTSFLSGAKNFAMKLLLTMLLSEHSELCVASDTRK
jgi:hypothetical protein